MAMFSGLNTMVRGIFVNQTALNTTGHNITNADTEGYSRQTVNVITTVSEYRSSVYGNTAVGTGAEIQAITRTRDVYADVQYRNENSQMKYYETLATNYDKLEVIFNDANNDGLQSQILAFYKSWVDLSTEASNSANRANVIEQGKNMVDGILSATQQLQEQIDYNYFYMNMNIKEVNDILESITKRNKEIVAAEVGGAMANDLRDQRDLLVDKLSAYMPVTIYEDEFGNYQVTSGGTTLVTGVERLHLARSAPIESKYFGENFGILDYSVVIEESNVSFIPGGGILQANLDAVDDCKSYINELADISAFLLTTFNDQHRQGYDMNGLTKDYTVMMQEYETTTDADGNTTQSIKYNHLGTGKGDYKLENGRYIYVGEGMGDYAIALTNGTYVYRAAESGEVPKFILNDDGTYTLTDDSDTAQYVIDLIATSDASTYDAVQVPDTINFFGNDDHFYTYSQNKKWGVNTVTVVGIDGVTQNLSGTDIINALKLNTKFDGNEGHRYVAAATAYDDSTDYSSYDNNGKHVTDSDTYLSRMVDWNERTGDGTNAVFMSELFNMTYENITISGRSNGFIVNRYADTFKSINPIGGQSINTFYVNMGTRLGVEASSIDTLVTQQDVVMTQAQNWRDATSGVDWNEELTNMIKYQKAFVACSRCLTAMDECLDRLVNSTGAIGR